MAVDERELIRCFLAGTCDSFSHEDHVHVAWLLLRQHPLAIAIHEFTKGAKRLAVSKGRPDIYHETLTWAYMAIINERMHRGPVDNWCAFREAHRDLFETGHAIVKQYYRPSTLSGDLARQIFLLPDIRPS